MVVADNKAYDYERYEYLEQDSQQQKKQLPKKNLKKKPKYGAQILNIAFIFALSVFIISRYAAIAEINFENKQLDKQISQAQTESRDLNVQLMKSVNLESLEKIAIGKLHMQYPDPMNSIIYIHAEKPAAALAANSSYHGVEDVQENKYLASVKSLVGNVLKILE